MYALDGFAADLYSSLTKYVLYTFAHAQTRCMRVNIVKHNLVDGIIGWFNNTTATWARWILIIVGFPMFVEILCQLVVAIEIFIAELIGVDVIVTIHKLKNGFFHKCYSQF